jgi:hypothetical protein
VDDNGNPTTWQGSLWIGTADLFVTISDGERLFFLSTCTEARPQKPSHSKTRSSGANLCLWDTDTGYTSLTRQKKLSSEIFLETCCGYLFSKQGSSDDQGLNFPPQTRDL